MPVLPCLTCPPTPRPGREPSISSDTRTDSSTESYSYRQPSHSHHESLASHYSSDSQGTIICVERPEGPLHASLCSLDTIGRSPVRWNPCLSLEGQMWLCRICAVFMYHLCWWHSLLCLSSHSIHRSFFFCLSALNLYKNAIINKSWLHYFS